MNEEVDGSDVARIDSSSSAMVISESCSSIWANEGVGDDGESLIGAVE